MSWTDFFKELGKGIMGEGVTKYVDNIKTQVREGVEETVERVLKSLIIFFMALLGFIFALAGLGKFLSERVDALNNGLGYLLIGIVLLLLALFAKLMMPQRR